MSYCYDDYYYYYYYYTTILLLLRAGTGATRSPLDWLAVSLQPNAPTLAAVAVTLQQHPGLFQRTSAGRCVQHRCTP